MSLSLRGHWRSVFFTIHTPCHQSWRGNRIAPLNPGVGTGLPEKNPSSGQRASGEGPEAMLSSQHRFRSVFFTIHTPNRESWRGHRIAPLNPGVGTGLPHSILAQDCPGVSQKTLEAQCCTALRPRTRRPDCAENTGSASVHTDALPDSPPGLPGKLRQRPAV